MNCPFNMLSTDLTRVLLRQRQVSEKVNFLLVCLCKKCSFGVRILGKDMWFMKNGSNIYFGEYGAQELVIISDHIHWYPF